MTKRPRAAAPNASDTRLVVGCMTGTSLDGLDAALVAILGSGLRLRANYLGRTDVSIAPIRGILRHIATGQPVTALQLLHASRRLGELHASAVARLCQDLGCARIDLVVAHGQTVWHAPADREGSPDAGLSLQLLDPWPIVRRLRVPVVYDLRQADLIAGGQGAPITPLADWILYRQPAALEDHALVVNLGGICNVTALASQPDQIRGGDIGPCNLLLDGLVQILLNADYDRDGHFTARGKPQPAVVDAILDHPFFARPFPASTGREDFTPAWVQSLAARFTPRITPHDLLASAAAAIARLIARRAADHASTRVILAGGGARNPALVAAIRKAVAPPAAVLLSDELGIPVEAREAVAFAVLGALSQDGVPITLPAVTGSSAPARAGSWVYP